MLARITDFLNWTEKVQRQMGVYACSFQGEREGKTLLRVSWQVKMWQLWKPSGHQNGVTLLVKYFQFSGGNRLTNHMAHWLGGITAEQWGSGSQNVLHWKTYWGRILELNALWLTRGENQTQMIESHFRGAEICAGLWLDWRQKHILYYIFCVLILIFDSWQIVEWWHCGLFY